MFSFIWRNGGEFVEVGYGIWFRLVGLMWLDMLVRVVLVGRGVGVFYKVRRVGELSGLEDGFLLLLLFLRWVEV